MTSGNEFVRFINPGDLPIKSEADALRALRDRWYTQPIDDKQCPNDTCLDRPELRFYSKGQYDDPGKNEQYRGEFYDTLLYNLSATPRPIDPRYAKVPLDESDFDYSRAHIDRDFLYHPQQAELFASPAGSWSDVHIGIFLTCDGHAHTSAPNV